MTDEARADGTITRWRGGTVLAPDGPREGHDLVARDGRVVGIEPAREASALSTKTARGETSIDAAGRLVAPGFVDLHVHGGGGADLVLDGTPEALATTARHHRAHGTTAFLATLMSAPVDRLIDALGSTREVTRIEGGAEVLGFHLEGPFLSPRRGGAHRPEDLRDPDPALLDRLVEASGGRVRLVTIAPELPGALELIGRLVRDGIVVAIGHTDADERTVRRALDAGATHATHLFNAMRPFHHRDPGATGALLDDARATAELICDGHHLAGAAIRLARRAKGRERIALVTDCMGAAPTEGATIDLFGRTATVRNGAPRFDDGTLAGSVLTMADAVARYRAATGVSLAEAAEAASRVPARVLGLARKGTFEIGADADVVLL